MGQRRTLIVGIGIIAVIILVGLLLIASFTISNNGDQVAFNTTSSAIASTNSYVGQAIAATSAARQNAPVAFYDTDQTSGVLDNSQELPTPTPAEGEPTKTGQTRIVLKNATVAITVKDPTSTINAISKIAEDQGGWIVTSSAYQQTSSTGAEQTYGNITIRVPSAKLDSILDQIKASAISVDSVNITGDDVTDQYTDLNSQLTNLQSARDQLRTIMNSATKTEDVLAVFNQLTNINGQIDVIQGKLKYYDQSAAYSSIAVTISPSQDSKPLAIGGWQPGNTVKSALESLVQLLQGLVDILIVLVIDVLPFLIVLFIAYRIYRRFRPRVIAPKTEQPSTNVENTKS